jgi:hypothetical protein
MITIKMIKNSKPSNHIVRILTDSFRKFVKKTNSKYHNVDCHVFSQETIDKNTRNHCFLKTTSNIVKR